MKKLLLAFTLLMSTHLKCPNVVISNATPPLTLATYKGGSVDGSFATSGFYTGPATTNSLWAVALQSDNKIVVGGNNASNEWLAARLNADGSIDTSFATNGFYTNTTGGVIYALEIQSDGKIILVGRNTAGRWYVARLNTDGSIDTSFATNGFYTHATFTRPYGLVIQSDGKIIIAGRANEVQRLDTNGSLDDTFGTSGTFTSSVVIFIHAIAVQPDGKIIIAGKDGTDWAVERLTVDGSLDDTFGGNNGDSAGSYTTAGGEVEFIVFQSNGKIILVGRTTDPYWYVARLNTDGSIDTNFATNGFYTNTDGHTVVGAAVQLDEKIILAGNNNSNNWRIGRLTVNGSLDDTFASGGFYVNATGENDSNDIEMATAIQPDGKIIVVGTNTSLNWYVGRLTNDIDPITQAASLLGGGFV